MSTASLPKQRVASIDLLRGAIMIIMALDHIRDYFHWSSFQYDPLDLGKTSAPIFFTRWITHYCAPIFMFLAGTSAFLVGQRKGKKELSAFLLKRGLWLVFLEMVVVNFGWSFDIQFHSIFFITIWALGISMICLSALVYLPMKAILAIGIVVVAGHNLLDGVNFGHNGALAFGWSLLHSFSLNIWHGEIILVGYPIIPWFAVMALGYCFGQLYVPSFDAARRKKLLLQMGLGCVLLFIVLRLINVYGDSSHWSQQNTPMFTLLSFINTSKYPPSLLYLLMTIGPALIFLSYTEKASGKITSVISVYGRVPMLYYLVHIYLIHIVAMMMSELFTSYDWSKWILHEPLWFTQDFKGYGYPLWVVYLVWAGIVVCLYPLCRWYDRYKQANKHKWWLSYL